MKKTVKGTGRRSAAGRSLIACAISLLICTAMLIGTTFAWFTDKVTNTGNHIEAGTLEVSLLNHSLTEDAAAYAAVTADPVFSYNLWEPGYSTGRYFKVRNDGTLALRYQLGLQGIAVTSRGTASDDASVLSQFAVTVNDAAAGTLADYTAGSALTIGTLAAGASSSDIKVVVKMAETAGNEYQGAAVNFDILLTATQYTAESDGSGSNQYDSAAAFSPALAGIVRKAAAGQATTVVSSNAAVQAVIPADTTAAGTELAVTASAAATPAAAFTAASTGSDNTVAYDIEVTGLPEGNTTPIAVSLNIGAARTGLIVYHNDTALTEAATGADGTYTYNSATGILTIYTSTFSPFAVGYKNGVKTAAEFTSAIAKAATGDMIAISGTIDLGGQTVAINKGITIMGGGITYGALKVNTSEPVVIDGVNFNMIAKTDEAATAPKSCTCKLSAIYAGTAGIVYDLTVKNCSFTDCKWDALQLVPTVDGYKFNILNNTFKNNDGFVGYRYLHIESRKYAAINSKNTMVWATGTFNVKGNTFSNIDKAHVTDSAATIAYVDLDAPNSFTGNTFNGEIVGSENGDALANIWIGCTKGAQYEGTEYYGFTETGYSTTQVKALFGI